MHSPPRQRTEPAILRWAEATVARLADARTPAALFGLIDSTVNQMNWLRVHEPDVAQQVDAAIREAHARLQPAAAPGGP